MAHNKSNIDVIQGIRKHWHGLNEIHDKLNLDTCWLSKWETVAVRLQKRGQDCKWSVLECSDIAGQEIGKPYNPETFKPITNADFIQLVRTSIAGTQHEVESVGSVRSRGRVFISVKLNGMEKFKVAGHEFSAHLNFGNGHDKSSVLWANTSNTDTVCDNTFTKNLVSVENKEKDSKDDISLKQRHTKNVELKLPAMADLIDKAIGIQGEFQLAFEELASESIAIVPVKQLFAGFIGRKAVKENGLSTRAVNTVDKLVELYKSGTGGGNKGETLADAFSAITDYYTHFSSGGDDKFRQFVSSEYGAGNTAKTDFFNIVTDKFRIKDSIELGELLLTNTKD